MTFSTNGVTADVIRDVMPPYQLSTDLLTAMLAAVPPPPSGATAVWRQQRCARLVHEVAGLMPANAPQARICAETVIVHEAIEDTLARANAPGLTADQVCRLRRTASSLVASVATLERLLGRHQQKPAPFFGTVLVDGIDVAALAAGWGDAGAPRDDREAVGAGGGAPMDGAGPAGIAGSVPAASVPPARRQVQVGQDLPATTVGEGAEMAMDAGPAVAVEPCSAMAEEAGSNDAAVVGEAEIGEIVQRPYGTEDGGGIGGAGAMGVTMQAHEPPGPGHDAGATAGVVTRLDQGPGWTLDVVRPRKVGEAVGE